MSTSPPPHNLTHQAQDTVPITRANQQVIHLDNTELYDRWAKVYDTDANILQKVDDQELIHLLPKLITLSDRSPSTTTPQTTAASTDAEVNDLFIVDFGCGTGRNTVKLLPNANETSLSPALNSLSCRILGLDASSEMLKIAQERCSSHLQNFCFSSPINSSSTQTPSAGSASPFRPQLEFKVFDANKDPIPSQWVNKADIVISTLVLEHLPLYVFFSTISKLLKLDGLLLLTNMSPDMGRDSQAGFMEEVQEIITDSTIQSNSDKDTGTGMDTQEKIKIKIRGTSFIYEIEEVVNEARKWGLELVSDDGVVERKVSEEDMDALGKRGVKWIGRKVWFGGIWRMNS